MIRGELYSYYLPPIQLSFMRTRAQFKIMNAAPLSTTDFPNNRRNVIWHTLYINIVVWHTFNC